MSAKYLYPLLGVTFLVVTTAMQAQSIANAGAQTQGFSAAAYVGPSDGRAQKLFAKAQKEAEDRKLALAVADFRKADQQDGGHCLPCEAQAYKAAREMDDLNAAR